MKNYMIIAKVNGQNYLTKVQAESESAAEHAILDKGICSKFGYGVEACMAYDDKAMKTDTFIYNALEALPLGINALTTEIIRANDRLREKETAEEKMAEIEKQMRELEKQSESLRKQQSELEDQWTELLAITRH